MAIGEVLVSSFQEYDLLKEDVILPEDFDDAQHYVAMLAIGDMETFYKIGAYRVRLKNSETYIPYVLFQTPANPFNRLDINVQGFLYSASIYSSPLEIPGSPTVSQGYFRRLRPGTRLDEGVERTLIKDIIYPQFL